MQEGLRQSGSKDVLRNSRPTLNCPSSNSSASLRYKYKQQNEPTPMPHISEKDEAAPSMGIREKFEIFDKNLTHTHSNSNEIMVSKRSQASQAG